MNGKIVITTSQTEEVYCISVRDTGKGIPEAIREGWIALFAHDPKVPAAYLRERDGKWEAEPVTID